jgi:hypothetical protein
MHPDRFASMSNSIQMKSMQAIRSEKSRMGKSLQLNWKSNDVVRTKDSEVEANNKRGRD